MQGPGWDPFEIHVMNEKGTRKVIPFKGVIPADAYLWAKYQGDRLLQEKLKEITQKEWMVQSKKYGVIGSHSVIKNVHALRSVETGSHAEIQGAHALHNVILCSSEEERTAIGEGVELTHGIIGYGCQVNLGAKAVRFVLGNHVTLSMGALLVDSFVGDNSTLSGCEVRNVLLFPAHEQHHNNSFLIAGLIKGQSNIAAGATLGSNHNSRANDGELEAGRGFWPGLCTSLKYPSRFASFGFE
jgi:carbonic anhydrase/acetyltransferase-like protein (isoleucine patch superfamily)